MGLEHYPPNDCTCGHSWENHHHSCIMNPKCPIEDHSRGICRGVMAEECEETQMNGEWLVPEKDMCFCGRYKMSEKRVRLSYIWWRIYAHCLRAIGIRIRLA
jgi:hypothetical protein